MCPIRYRRTFPLSGGKAKFTLSTLKARKHRISAYSGGSTYFLTSKGKTVTLTVKTEDIGNYGVQFKITTGLTKIAKLDLVTKEAKQAENLRKLLLAIADDALGLLEVDGQGLERIDRELLHAIVKDLHAGKTVEEVKPRFEELIQDVEATEIAAIATDTGWSRAGISTSMTVAFLAMGAGAFFSSWRSATSA